jgi:hypothetical protein
VPEDTPEKPAYRVEITEVVDANNDGAIDLFDVERLLKTERNVLILLTGYGDFRSAECIAPLEEADIVVTNPPFSLFRQYVGQLVEHGKKFLILGNQNAITYSEIFKLIKENRLWLGYHNGDEKWFRVPDGYDHTTDKSKIKVEDGVRYLAMKNMAWFTNLDTTKRHEVLTLYKAYNTDSYPKYANYDAIEVPRYADIPYDYDGVMGVPITFLDKYNPDQFEIVGTTESSDPDNYLRTRWYSAQECRDAYFARFGKPGVYDLNASGVVDGVKVFKRILIRRKGCRCEDRTEGDHGP